jgi:hypothetical protein
VASGRVIRSSANLANREVLARLSKAESAIGLPATAQEPGATLTNPSSQTSWTMAPGTAITFFDAAGIKRVILGALPSGDYGLQVADPSDVSNEIWPVSSGFALGGSSSATSPTALSPASDSPTVECFLGASGDAIITCSASIYAATANLVANVNLAIDGTSPTDAIIVEARLLAGVGVPGSAAIRLSDWWTALGGTMPTPSESHTFSLLYSVTTSAADFSNIGLMVQPL